MHILFSSEEIQLLEELQAAGIDPLTIIVHIFMKYGANYEQVTEPINPEDEPEIIDQELADEFAGALIVSDYVVKREISEVE